jgi:maltooligosyltrehalose synthase
VFDDYHRLILDLDRQGSSTGCGSITSMAWPIRSPIAAGCGAALRPDAYLVVEKILQADERLSADLADPRHLRL